MTAFENKQFKQVEVEVDGNTYTNCVFDNAVLVFAGGEPPTFTRCTFRSIKIELKGAAAQTTQYLRQLYANDMPDAVEDVLGDVQEGFVLLPDHPDDCPPINRGEHYGRLGLIALALTAFVVWLGGMYVYGFVLGPLNTLENGEPLIREVSFDVIPRLPDQLAVEYDRLVETQLNRLESDEINEQTGNARVTIDTAIDVLLERGFPVRTDGGEFVDETVNADLVIEEFVQETQLGQGGD